MLKWMMSISLCLGPIMGVAEQNSQPVAADVSDVQTMVGYFTTAWNEHRPQVMAAQWTVDGDFIDPRGRWVRSRSAVENLFVNEQNGNMRDSSLVQNVLGMQFITPDVALVDVELIISGGKDVNARILPPLKNRGFYVLKKITGKWWIASARFY